MKKDTAIILLSGVLFAFAACTQPSNNNVSFATIIRPLNSTEAQLVGTWYVSEQDKQYYIGGVPSSYQDTFKPGTPQYYADSNYADIYFTATGNSIQFTADQFASTPAADDSNYKQVYDASYGLSTQGYAVPTGGNATNFWWYYNINTSLLIINTYQFQIVSLTSTDLIITNTLAGNPYTLVYTCHLQK